MRKWTKYTSKWSAAHPNMDFHRGPNMKKDTKGKLHDDANELAQALIKLFGGAEKIELARTNALAKAGPETITVTGFLMGGEFTLHLRFDGRTW